LGTTNPAYKLDVAGAVMAGSLIVNGTIDASNNKITSVASPTNPSDVATKGYVDSVSVACILQTCPHLSWECKL